MPKAPKKVKSGKIKRHKLRKKLGVKQGFGKPWSAPSTMFRVEFSWLNPDETEENEQVHWVECRKFQGEERRFLHQHYQSSAEGWTEKETLESKFVCVHIAKYLAQYKDTLHINQGFVFPTTKKDNETIREPIYIIQWTENLAKGIGSNINIDLVLKNSIYHHSI